TGGKGLGAVIDTRRPLGLYANWEEKKEEPGEDVYFVPVADEKALLGLLPRLGLKLGQPDGPVQRLVQPFGLSDHFFRFAHGHVFVAEDARLLKGTLPDPARPGPPGGQTALVTRRAPDGRLLGVALRECLEAALQDLKEEARRQPGETNAQFQRRREDVARKKAFVDSIFEGGQDLRGSLNLERD